MPFYPRNFDHEKDHACGDCERECETCRKLICVDDEEFENWKEDEGCYFCPEDKEALWRA